MTRGPTSSVMISSASPLLSLRLFFQPRYSTFSMVTPAAGASVAVSKTPASVAQRQAARPDRGSDRTTVTPLGRTGDGTNRRGETPRPARHGPDRDPAPIRHTPARQVKGVARDTKKSPLSPERPRR